MKMKRIMLQRFCAPIIFFLCALEGHGVRCEKVSNDNTTLRFLWESSMQGLADVALWNIPRGLSRADNGGFQYTDSLFVQILAQLDDKHRSFGYGMTESWLHDALESYSFAVKDKAVLVVGSTTPVYEAFALTYGAKEVTVVEYGPRIATYPNVAYISPAEFDRPGRQFDAIISVSSVEHDGLGRYGDPLAPHADIKSMAKLRHYLRKDGLVFLSVPVGQDAVVYNAHRVYGAHRLPLLIDCYEVLDTFGFSPRDFEDRNWAALHQPVFVLEHPKFFREAGHMACNVDGGQAHRHAKLLPRVQFEAWRAALIEESDSGRRELLCDQPWCRTMLPHVVALPSLVRNFGASKTLRPASKLRHTLDRYLKSVKVLVDIRKDRASDDELYSYIENIYGVRIFTPDVSDKCRVNRGLIVEGVSSTILERYDHLRRVNTVILTEKIDDETCEIMRVWQARLFVVTQKGGRCEKGKIGNAQIISQYENPHS
eukprot:g175.t1